jgi:hypothetical protein
LLDAVEATTAQKASRNAGPNPSPATAVPKKKTAGVPVEIEPNMTTVPAIRTRLPPSITLDGSSLGRATADC